MNIRIFIKNLENQILLDKDIQYLIFTKDNKIFHYLYNVLHIKLNDNIVLFNEKIGELSFIISEINKKNIKLIFNKYLRKFEIKSNLHLLFPIIKSNYLIEMLTKAVQLNVSNFTPIITERTNIHVINSNRLMLNMIESLEQSNGINEPCLNKIIPFSKLLAEINKNQNIIFFGNERSANNTTDYNQDYAITKLKQIINENNDLLTKEIYLIVGPEGGFSDFENEILNKMQYSISIKLGNRILKSETAMITLIAKVESIFKSYEEKFSKTITNSYNLLKQT